MRNKLLFLLYFLSLSFFGKAQHVGINTTNPQATLDVKGNQRFGGNTSYLKFDSASGKIEWIAASLFVPTSQHIIRHSASGEGLYAGGGKLEYRSTAAAVFYSDWITGNGYFKGRLGISIINPLAGLHVADSSVLFSATGDIPGIAGSIPQQGYGRRMMWYADKAAFRAGFVNGDQWEQSNIGSYSFATGNSTIAAGNYSTALGVGTNASGNGSTTLGRETIASGEYSIATGFGSNASGYISTALGVSTIASGEYSTAIGNSSEASGNYSIAMGENINARSVYEIVLGRWNTEYTPTGGTTDRSFSIGNGTGAITRSDALTILKNGNIGIGTSTPAFKFDVRNGSINTDSVYRIGAITVLAVPGDGNLFVGKDAGRINTGYSNTFSGDQAGHSNTSGSYNSFYGKSAGTANTLGYSNSFFGLLSGFSNTTGKENSFFGVYAGYSTTSGSYNSFYGLAAGFSNNEGENNSFFGNYAGYLNNYGSQNSFFGMSAGSANTSGWENSFFGTSAGLRNSTGYTNSFFGLGAGRENTTGYYNSFNGPYAGYLNTTGFGNTADGYIALGSNTTGTYNTAVGVNANVGSGALTNATAIGAHATVNCSNCLVLGNGVNVGIGTNNPTRPLSFTTSLGKKISLYPGVSGDAGFGVFGNELRMHSDHPGADITFGYDNYTTGFTERMRIKGNGNVGFGTNTPAFPISFGPAVGDKISLWSNSSNSYGFGIQSSLLQIHTDVNTADIAFGFGSSGSLFENMRIKGNGNVGIGTMSPTERLDVNGNIKCISLSQTSDSRLKKDIVRIQNSLQKLTQLNGYNYYWKDEASGTGLQTGILAQELQKLFPELVKEGKDGMLSVNYSGLIPVLVESIKAQNESIKAQNESIKQQQKQIDELSALVEKLLTQKVK